MKREEARMIAEELAKAIAPFNEEFFFSQAVGGVFESERKLYQAQQRTAMREDRRVNKIPKIKSGKVRV